MGGGRGGGGGGLDGQSFAAAGGMHRWGKLIRKNCHKVYQLFLHFFTLTCRLHETDNLSCNRGSRDLACVSFSA